MYLSINDPSGIEEAFANIGATAENIDLVVVTDGEAYLELVTGALVVLTSQSEN